MLKPGPATEAWLCEEQRTKAMALTGRASRAPSKGLAFFAPFFSLQDSEPWLIGEEVEFQEFARESLPKIEVKAEPSSADFQNTFENILARIHRGEFEKVVPMVCEELEFEKSLSRTMFSVKPEPSRFSYGFEYGDEGMAGLSPELLFSVEGGELSTMALAGTGKAIGPSLLEDPKEMHEHHLVIRHIEAELKKFGKIDIGRTMEREYGAIKHLFTPIKVKLDEAPRFMEFVQALHPTAALGGWPRKPAVEWLEKQPFHSTRKRFGAPFGYQDGENMKCVVAIRGVQWNKNRLLVASGCGIVRESQVLKEWSELELKRDSIYRWLGVSP